MNKITKKIIAVSASIIISGLFVVGCGQKDNKDKGQILSNSDDAKIKTVIITQSEKENKLVYDAANKEKMDSEYRKHNYPDYKNTVVHYSLPDDYENSKKTDEIFDKIKNDKDVNVLVVSSDKPGLADRVKKLKNERKDIITVSSDLNDSDKKLIKDFDFNFKTGDFNHGERIVDLAKSLGAERFIYFISNKELENKNNVKILDGIKKEGKKINIPVEEVEIPKMDNIYEEKAFVANKIDYLVKKYGKDINIYTFDSKFDEILATKVFDEKFFISEFSSKNISPELMKIYGLKNVTRQAKDYVWMNSQIGAYIKMSSDMERRIGATAYNPQVYTMRIATDIGDVVKSKNMDKSKLYNSVFLERVSNIKNKVGCGFINGYNGIGNFKILDVDQILY